MRLLIGRSRDANCDFFMHVTRNGKVEARRGRRKAPRRSLQIAEATTTVVPELYPNGS